MNFLKSNIFFLILLTVVAFCLYGKTINFGFTYGDDSNMILEKADLLSDIKNLPTLFTTSCYYSKHSSYYRPLLNVSFMAETLLFGINTHIYHLTNIILFILSLYLMYLFSKKLLKKCTQPSTLSPQPSSVILSDSEGSRCSSVNSSPIHPFTHSPDTILKYLFLLIAVHPIFTSTVAWIPARNDTLLAVFMYASLIFFVNWLENKKVKDLFLYFIFFALALFTKESSILTVFVFAALVWCFNYKLTKKEIAINILIVVPIIIFYLYFRQMAVAEGNLLMYLIAFGDTIRNMMIGSMVYLFQFVVPDVHIMFYNVKFSAFHFIVVFFIFLFVCFALYKKMIDKKVFLWCVFVFVLFILPTCFLDDYIILNHRLVTVIPAIIIPLTMFVEKIISVRYIKIGLVSLFVFAFVIFNCVSFVFANNFRDKNIYWYQSYLDAPDCHATCYWMGRLFLENGRLDKAKEFFAKANELRLIYLCDLALVAYFEGDFDLAEQLYQDSVKIGINKAQCFRNLSTIYYQRDKDFDKAVKYAEMAIQEEPLEAEYRKYFQALLNEKNKNTL